MTCGQQHQQLFLHQSAVHAQPSGAVFVSEHVWDAANAGLLL